MNITEQDGKGNVTYYKYFREENGQIIIDENGKDRDPTDDELALYLEEKAEQQIVEEKEQAKIVIEEAKQSDNPEIANLAEAFSKLLPE